jgi:hypothetical protein
MDWNNYGKIALESSVLQCETLFRIWLGNGKAALKSCKGESDLVSFLQRPKCSPNRPGCRLLPARGAPAGLPLCGERKNGEASRKEGRKEEK